MRDEALPLGWNIEYIEFWCQSFQNLPDASIQLSFCLAAALFELKVLVAMALQLLGQIARHLRSSSVQAAILVTISAALVGSTGSLKKLTLRRYLQSFLIPHDPSKTLVSEVLTCRMANAVSRNVSAIMAMQQKTFVAETTAGRNLKDIWAYGTIKVQCIPFNRDQVC